MRSIIIKLCLLAVIVIVETDAYKGWHWKRRCPYVKCEEPCKKERDEKWCFKCVCEPICDIPKCEPECELKKTEDDLCPKCECPEKKIPFVPAEVKCPPVECGKYCRPRSKLGECPVCVCRPPRPCPVLKCNPGCFAEKDFDSPCPKCECKEEEEKFDIEARDKGLDLKKEKIDYDAKGKDMFDLEEDKKIDVDDKEEDLDYKDEKMDLDEEDKKFDLKKKDEEFDIGKVECGVPKCPPGCEIEKEFKGPCPGCECKEEKKPCIEPPVCKRYCKLKETEDGCKVCECPKRRFG